MIKNYEAAIDEKYGAYSNYCVCRNEWCVCCKAALDGAEFAFNYQQAKIDKLAEALKYINGEHGIKAPAMVISCHVVAREALTQLEIDGE